MSDSFDALIIGGGPGGATSAILLARAGWSVALVERKAFPRRKVCGEYLSATSLPLLDQVGLGEAFRDAAGPKVKKVGLFCGEQMLSSDLPRPSHREWGRALGRETLDTLLLRQAESLGVRVYQPYSVVHLAQEGDRYCGEVTEQGTSKSRLLRSRVVVAAHGSWDPGPLPTQRPRHQPKPDDLLGFKAHFRDADLPEGMMPLLAFPGGYGGLVHTDQGRVSLSCCVRRERLARLRVDSPGQAGEAVVGFIMDSCRGVRRALGSAVREGAWLSAGPIRPGIRLEHRGGIFPVGNVAGEAHPVVAEGIGMAMQGAWLLTRSLRTWKNDGFPNAALGGIGREYSRAWRRRFGPRLYAAAAIAQWAMHPTCVAGTIPFLRLWPRLLTWGARLSGKATNVVA